jgi:hypothetical protein
MTKLYIPIATRRCTWEDLTNFPDIKQIVAKPEYLYCMSENQTFQLEKAGLWNFARLQIGVGKCEGPQCYQGAELATRLSEIATEFYFMNQVFDDNEFEPAKIIKSNMNHIMTQSLANPKGYFYSLKRNKAQTSGDQILWFFLPEYTTEFWSFEATQGRENFLKNYDFVQIELSLDQNQYKRSDYSLLQLLGDVGALFDVLLSIFGLFLSYLF